MAHRKKTQLILPNTPLMTLEDFNVPPLAPKGDNQPDKLYLAVGLALSRWAMVEDALGFVFARLLQTHSSAAHRVLGVLTSFGAKADVIDAAADRALHHHEQHLAEEKNRLKVWRKASYRRNEIVHGHVANYRDIGHVLMPGHSNPRKVDWRGDEPKYRYNTTIVLKFAHKFQILMAQTFDFDRELETILPAWKKTPREPSPEQPE